MSKQALGLIEVIGLATAVEVADAALKSANVQLIGYELAKGGGMTTIKFEGDVGAVKAAVDSGKIIAMKSNALVSTLVIPRPSTGTELIVNSCDTVGLKKNEEPALDPKAEEVSSEDTTIKIAEIEPEIPLEEPKEEVKEEPPLNIQDTETVSAPTTTVEPLVETNQNTIAESKRNTKKKISK